MVSKITISSEAVAQILDNATVTVSSSSGLGCPDQVLLALGKRFDAEGHSKNLTMLLPIAAGDIYGIKSIDHIAKANSTCNFERNGFVRWSPDCKVCL